MELLEQFAWGDAHAFEALFRRPWFSASVASSKADSATTGMLSLDTIRSIVMKDGVLIPLEERGPKGCLLNPVRRIRHRGHPAKGRLTFLRNHREGIVAYDFFTVPTITFQLLYCFFVIEHGRRKILHFNVTRHPSAEWVVQQLPEAFPEAAPYRYVILDRDSKLDAGVVVFLKAAGLEPKRTSVQSPGQNGIAERWVGSCRCEILDHVIVFNEEHFRRLMRDCVNYHHQDRIHDSLEKDTPNRRPIEQKPSAYATVISSARLGGLHQR